MIEFSVTLLVIVLLLVYFFLLKAKKNYQLEAKNLRMLARVQHAINLYEVKNYNQRPRYIILSDEGLKFLADEIFENNQVFYDKSIRTGPSFSGIPILIKRGVPPAHVEVIGGDIYVEVLA